MSVEINPNLNTNFTSQSMTNSKLENSNFYEVLKQESEFLNFNDEELNSARQNYTSKNQIKEGEKFTGIEINNKLREMATNALNQTQIQDLDTGEFKSFKEVFDGIKFQARNGELGEMSENFFQSLNSQISMWLMFNSLNGENEVSIEKINIVKKGDTILAGVDIRKANGELKEIALNVEDFYALDGVAAQIELGENKELLPFMQKYAQSNLDLVKDLSKDSEDYGLKRIKKDYENYLEDKRKDYEKYGFVSYNDLAQKTQANLIQQSAKNSTLENNLLKELLKS